jgi:hypothetical protein
LGSIIVRADFLAIWSDQFHLEIDLHRTADDKRQHAHYVPGTAYEQVVHVLNRVGDLFGVERVADRLATIGDVDRGDIVGQQRDGEFAPISAAGFELDINRVKTGRRQNKCLDDGVVLARQVAPEGAQLFSGSAGAFLQNRSGVVVQRRFEVDPVPLLFAKSQDRHDVSLAARESVGQARKRLIDLEPGCDLILVIDIRQRLGIGHNLYAELAPDEAVSGVEVKERRHQVAEDQRHDDGQYDAQRIDPQFHDHQHHAEADQGVHNQDALVIGRVFMVSQGAAAGEINAP